MTTDLDKEFQYFLAHRKELLQDYIGKFLIIKDQTVQGAYKSEIQAIQAAMRKFELGTFIVQQCAESRDSYTRMFRSRAIFA